MQRFYPRLKQLTLFHLFSFITGYAFSQQVDGQNAYLIQPQPFSPTEITHLAKEQSQTGDWWTGFPFVVDYSRLNNDNRHVIYMLNSRLPFTGKNDLRSATTAFNRIIDPAGLEYIFSPTSQVMMDTIYLWLGHENNSNKNDTLIIDILHTDEVSGYPTEEYLNQRTIITDRSITNPTINDWRFGAAIVKIHAGNLVGKNRKFAVRVRYYGSFLDTFGIVAGFKNEGPCTNPNLYSPAVSTRKSNYYPNSYRLTSDAPEQYPTPEGADLYRDCNNNQVADTLDMETDWHLHQNFNVSVLLRYDSLSMVPVKSDPVREASFVSVYPNPSTGSFQIEAHLFEGLSSRLILTDLSGKVVYQADLEPKPYVQETLNLKHLSPGMYFVTIETTQSNLNTRLLLK